MLPIVRAVDGKVISRVVTLSTATKLSDHEKLEALRRLDQFRQWPSLEEKRYCLVCGELIAGHEIQVVGGTRGNEALRLNCPTEGCNSIPMDWVLATNEILAKVERMAAGERKAFGIKTRCGRERKRRNSPTWRPTPQARVATAQIRFSVQAIFLKLSPPIPAGLEPPGKPAG